MTNAAPRAAVEHTHADTGALRVAVNLLRGAFEITILFYILLRLCIDYRLREVDADTS